MDTGQWNSPCPDTCKKHWSSTNQKKPKRATYAQNTKLWGKEKIHKGGSTGSSLADEKNKLIQVVGKFLYYRREVDPKPLISLGTMALKQTKVTTSTLKSAKQLLDYCATHLNKKLMNRAIVIFLLIHSNVLYLSETKARSRACGLLFLGSNN